MLSLGTLLIMACNQVPKMEADEYRQWVSKSGQEHKTEKLIVKCTFLPADFILLQELGNAVLEEQDTVARRKELQQSLHFNLSYQTATGTSILDRKALSEEEKTARENYLRWEIMEDLSLEAGESINPALVHLVDNYGIKQETEVLVVFKRPKADREFTLHLNNQLIDKQDFTFTFDRGVIPHLIKQ